MNDQMLHVWFEGQSFDFPLSDLDVGELTSDDQVRAVVAARLNAPVSKLAGFTLDRHEGSMTLRPQAVFGHE